MADDRKAFLLRTDPLLWREIEKWAADELRSVNGQIEFILRDAVRKRKGSAAGEPQQAGGWPTEQPPTP